MSVAPMRRSHGRLRNVTRFTRQQIMRAHEMKKKGLWSPNGVALFLPLISDAWSSRHRRHAHHSGPPDGKSNCACATVALTLTAA